MMQLVTRFPSRLYHFIWRNWDLVRAQRLASFLKTSVSNVRDLAGDLGLGAQPAYLTALRSRLRSLVIRRNWFLLPMAQIGQLLGMDMEALQEFMHDDDFLNLKLPPKPRCASITYREPIASQRQAAQHLRKLMSAIPEPERSDPSFSFLESLRKGRADVRPPRIPSKSKWVLSPRIMHPYDTPHNLTAFEPENTPVPYLRLMRDFGADALWFPGSVFDLVHLPGYPEFGGERDRIVPRLRSLIRRARKAGLGIFLYICEPRGQYPAFFRRHPDLEGVRSKHDAQIRHICTSTPAGQALVRDSIRELCRSLPSLAGLIDISASEYPSHCWSHGHGAECPRCGKRRPADVLAELLGLMQEGIEASGQDAHLIAWNWGWQWALKKRKSCGADITLLDLAADARDYIFQKLPDKVTPLLNLEYGTRVRRGGVENCVWEYTISQPGQGPYTAIQKRSLDRLGRDALARIHISSSTEFLGGPYIPVLHLVAEKLADVRDKGYKGFMGSWIFGGYPSPNLLVAREMSRRGKPEPKTVLHKVAGLYYGGKNAERVVRAWQRFSEAFRKYPFSIPLQYSAPLHIAPAVEWPMRPSGRKSLTYWPSDDPENYCLPYDVATVKRVFSGIADGWEKGLALLQEALERADVAHRRIAERDYGVAEVFWLCCRSFVNHMRFCCLRGKAVRSAAAREELRSLVEDEIALAERYYSRLRSDSRIGFEASMQYFILANDVREKIVGLRQLLEKLRKKHGSER